MSDDRGRARDGAVSLVPRSADHIATPHDVPAVDDQLSSGNNDGGLGWTRCAHQDDVSTTSGSQHVVGHTDRRGSASRGDVDTAADVVVASVAGAPAHQSGASEHVGVPPRRPQVADAVLTEAHGDAVLVEQIEWERVHVTRSDRGERDLLFSQTFDDRRNRRIAVAQGECMRHGHLPGEPERLRSVHDLAHLPSAQLAAIVEMKIDTDAAAISDREDRVEMFHRRSVEPRGVDSADEVSACRHGGVEQIDGPRGDEHPTLGERDDLHLDLLRTVVCRLADLLDRGHSVVEIDIDVGADQCGTALDVRIEQCTGPFQHGRKVTTAVAFVVDETGEPTLRIGRMGTPRKSPHRLVEVGVPVDQAGERQVAVAVDRRSGRVGSEIADRLDATLANGDGDEIRIRTDPYVANDQIAAGVGDRSCGLDHADIMTDRDAIEETLYSRAMGTSSGTGFDSLTCRQVELFALPDGDVKADHFAVAVAEVGEPRSGEVLVRLRRLGLNAGLAHRLGGPATRYGPSIGIGDVPVSDGVVEVIRSEHDDFEPGDLAVGPAAWRTLDVRDAAGLRPIRPEGSGESLDEYLTVLGHVGFTAYTGMIHIGEVTTSDVVYVSAAAGGVGSCAVQFAKARGATVFGCAGSDAKVEAITNVLGADGAVNHHDGPASDLLHAVAPDGIDLYFDNVGGDQLEAALDRMNHGGRIVICGAVSQGSRPTGPSNYRRMIYQEITMRGFAVTEHEDLRDEFESTVGDWIAAGSVRSLHTAFEGFDTIPEAFESLLHGTSTGRVIVSVDSR